MIRGLQAVIRSAEGRGGAARHRGRSTPRGCSIQMRAASSAPQTGDVEPGSLARRRRDGGGGRAGRARAGPRPGAVIMVANELITWWRTGGRSTGPTTALKTPDTVRALAKDVLARRAGPRRAGRPARLRGGDRRPGRGFDEEQLKAPSEAPLAAAVDRRARADDEGRRGARAAALVRRAGRRSARPRSRQSAEPRRHVERRGGGRAQGTRQRNNPRRRRVAARGREDFSGAEQRLETSAARCSATPHGRDGGVRGGAAPGRGLAEATAPRSKRRPRRPGLRRGQWIVDGRDLPGRGTRRAT